MQYGLLADDQRKAWKLIESKRLRGVHVKIHGYRLVVRPEVRCQKQSNDKQFCCLNSISVKYCFVKLLFIHFPVHVVRPHVAKRLERWRNIVDRWWYTAMRRWQKMLRRLCRSARKWNQFHPMRWETGGYEVKWLLMNQELEFTKNFERFGFILVLGVSW